MSIHSSKVFVIWCTEAATEFVNGCMDGILVGSGGGVISVAQTDTLSPHKLIINGLLGFAAGMGLSGISAFKVWHKSNRIPNPFHTHVPPTPSGPAAPSTP